VAEDREQAHESVLFWDLVGDVSLDPTWRRRLFDAEVGQRFPFSETDILRLSPRLRARIQEDQLRFACFNDH
jgi:hypothetical protein